MPTILCTTVAVDVYNGVQLVTVRKGLLPNHWFHFAIIQRDVWNPYLQCSSVKSFKGKDSISIPGAAGTKLGILDTMLNYTLNYIIEL